LNCNTFEHALFHLFFGLNLPLEHCFSHSILKQEPLFESFTSLDDYFPLEFLSDFLITPHDSGYDLFKYQLSLDISQSTHLVESLKLIKPNKLLFLQFNSISSDSVEIPLECCLNHRLFVLQGFITKSAESFIVYTRMKSFFDGFERIDVKSARVESWDIGFASSIHSKNASSAIYLLCKN
jgi:hypothetical protein